MLLPRLLRLFIKDLPWKRTPDVSLDALEEKVDGENFEFPDELYLHPELQLRNGHYDQFILSLAPKVALEGCIALDDVERPRRVTYYKKVRTMWGQRDSKVVEVEAPITGSKKE